MTTESIAGPGFEVAPSAGAGSPSSVRPIDVLALGMSWFPEQAGNGLDRVYHELGLHLAGAGVAMRGLVAGTSDVLAQSEGRVRAFASDSDRLAGRLRGVRRATRAALAERRPRLVASHFALYTAPVLDVVKGIPLVVHFHGPWAAESSVEGGSAFAGYVKRRLERAVYTRAIRLVVLSSAFRDVLVGTYGVDEGLVRVVPGGVDTDRFAPNESRSEARRRLGWPDDRPVLVAVRRLAHRMGLENLVDAVDAVRARHPDVLLYVAGRGPLEGSLRERVAETGLGDNVRFLGFVADEDLPAVYRAADLSVVPTVALEGFGLTTVESLASGTPVLVTPQGGLPEVVSDLDPLLVCRDSTPGAIAERIGSVLDGGFRLPSGEECRSYACERFAWPSIAMRVADVYREALA